MCFRICDSLYLQVTSQDLDPYIVEDVEEAMMGKTSNEVLRESCRRGSLFMVNKAIDLGANDWNEGLWGACYGGHLSCVEKMVELGATNTNIIPTYFPEYGTK